jgi:hypothetical protein
MQSEDIARRVAADLAPEFGPALTEKTEQALKGQLLAAPARTRSLTPDLHTVADVSVIATFLVTLAPIARNFWSELKDKTAVKSAITGAVKLPTGVKAELGEKIIDAVVNRSEPNT